MTAPAKLRIMDKVQAYAEIYALVGSKLDNGSASDDAKRIKLEIDCLVSREVEDKSVLLETVCQDHNILRNADHVMMSDTFARLELLNYRDGIQESMLQLDLRRDSLIQWLKCE